MRLTSFSYPLLLGVLLASGSMARAEVADSNEYGFSIHLQSTVAAGPQEVYRKLVSVDQWWESSHTYSGDARNLYIEPRAKGWFGERLPDDGVVQHMEVLFAAPGKMLRMRGALGPLQMHAVTGVLTVSLVAEGEATAMKVSYQVGGYMPGGLAQIAPMVNTVISDQFQRLQRLAETGKAD